LASIEADSDDKTSNWVNISQDMIKELKKISNYVLRNGFVGLMIPTIYGLCIS
jgi:hypothetical protein